MWRWVLTQVGVMYKCMCQYVHGWMHWGLGEYMCEGYMYLMWVHMRVIPSFAWLKVDIKTYFPYIWLITTAPYLSLGCVNVGDFLMYMDVICAWALVLVHVCDVLMYVGAWAPVCICTCTRMWCYMHMTLCVMHAWMSLSEMVLLLLFSPYSYMLGPFGWVIGLGIMVFSFKWYSLILLGIYIYLS